MTRNEILFQKKRKIVPQVTQKDQNNQEQVATFLKNLEFFGFTCSKELVSDLMHTDLSKLYDELIPVIKDVVGYSADKQPFYPNFPRQVMEASKAELYINAMLHYLSFRLHDISGGAIKTWFPDYEKQERPDLIDNHALAVIGKSSEEEFKQLFTEILSSNKSLSEKDFRIIDYFVDSYKESIFEYIPSEIKQKETLTYLFTKIYREELNVHGTFVYGISTATDVLRIAVALSDGDVSLSNKPEFKSFKRSERRFLLRLLDGIKDPLEDMLRYKNEWIRLGEKLHPGEYKGRFLNAFYVFDNIRNDLPREATFNSKVELAISNRNYDRLIELLRQRPGEFARRLDHIFRLFPNKRKHTLYEFHKVGKKISTPVLLQLYGFFKGRCQDSEFRLFFPKGNLMKPRAVENNLETYDSSFVNNVLTHIGNVLTEKFKKQENLGKVYLDENLKNYAIPFESRTLPDGLKTIARGSQLPIETDSVLRMFLHWKNIPSPKIGNNGRVDLDLSGIVYDENWNYVTHVSYTDVQNERINSYHSGDITDAPEGAVEFIDFDLVETQAQGGRYIVMNVFSFTSQPYYEIPECFVGWMKRRYPETGEVFDARTVQNKIDLSGDAQNTIVFAVDLEEKKLIWLDFAVKVTPQFNRPNNVETNSFNISTLSQAMVESQRMNLYELMKLHTLARAEEIVEKKEDADIVFDTSELPYQFDYIGSEFMQ